MWTRSLFENEYGLSGDVCYPGIDFIPKHESFARQDRIITASRHYPWKRIDLAFEVLKTLQKPMPTLVVCGDFTSHTRTLRERAVSLEVADNVDFTGFVSDKELGNLFSTSLVYVQTSIHEPFGLGPLEAQSYGTPAVVWGDAGVKETVLDTETGFHAKPYDLKDFGGKVQQLRSDETAWRRLSRNARVWATKFSWNSHVDLLEGVLDEARK
jgi:glycosyltransferase involved in cell wall biosynthesis